ncbi:hypothetical protein TI04_08050 [Achromatium sp. WMS2]|nr:hypothetical protein TI04_08050 [Achromatium sp. WMS2]
MPTAFKRYYLYLLLLIVVGCQSPGGLQPPPIPPDPRSSNYPTHHQLPPVTKPRVPNPASLKPLPELNGEPVIAVLLLQHPKTLTFTLLKDGIIEGSATDAPISIPHGQIIAVKTSDGITTNVTGARIFEQLIINTDTSRPGVNFKATLKPPFGPVPTLAFAGQPELIIDPDTRDLLLIEMVPLETYLQGVLPTEISPKWPLEAIKAQAVTARSYTLDRYFRRWNKPWQLHWHFTVDMAYGGFKPLNNRMQVALEQTRGNVLALGKLPVPTFFHACSGGTTESVHNFRPKLLAADDYTDVTAVMPVVNDPYAMIGARSLGNINSHMNWQAKISMAEINTKIKEWARKRPQDNMPTGKIIDIQIESRFADSGRVQTVLISHQVADTIEQTPIAAATFRLAVSPVKIRSTNWTECTKTKSGTKDFLMISGHGFGHGVGLSQISAYGMALEGKSARDIVQLFYPGANLVDWW